MLTAWIDIANMGHFVVQVIEKFRLQRNPQFPCYGRKVDRGIGGASDGTVNDNSIFKCLSSHDGSCRNITLCQLHDLSSRLSGIGEYITHSSRHNGSSGKRHTQSLRHTLHRAGSSQEGTSPTGRAACKFVISDLLLSDSPFTLLPQRNVSGNQRCGHIRAGAHTASRNKDCRHVQTGRCF